MRAGVLIAALLVGVLGLAFGPTLPAAEEAEQVRFTPPSAELVQQQLQAFLEQAGLKDEQLKQLAPLWQKLKKTSAPPERLKTAVEVLARTDPRFAQLAARCARPWRAEKLPQWKWLEDDTLPPFVQHNLRLYYARWLALQQLYDEALEQFRRIDPEQVIDPAGYFFYLAVAHHGLAHKKEGLQALDVLLAEVDRLPRRYRTLGELMREDLRRMREGSLDQVARWMRDVERRLQLARAGRRVIKREDDIIDALDKMIEQLEKQQQQQQQQQQQGGGQRQSSSPAQDSAILGGSGPGKVDPKNIGNSAGWGNLPPKKREEALQEIGKNFPAHYRELIEEYFRRVAEQEK